MDGVTGEFSSTPLVSLFYSLREGTQYYTNSFRLTILETAFISCLLLSLIRRVVIRLPVVADGAITRPLLDRSPEPEVLRLLAPNDDDEADLMDVPVVCLAEDDIPFSDADRLQTNKQTNILYYTGLIIDDVINDKRYR